MKHIWAKIVYDARRAGCNLHVYSQLAVRNISRDGKVTIEATIDPEIISVRKKRFSKKYEATLHQNGSGRLLKFDFLQDALYESKYNFSTLMEKFFYSLRPHSNVLLKEYVAVGLVNSEFNRSLTLEYFGGLRKLGEGEFSLGNESVTVDFTELSNWIIDDDYANLKKQILENGPGFVLNPDTAPAFTARFVASVGKEIRYHYYPGDGTVKVVFDAVLENEEAVFPFSFTVANKSNQYIISYRRGGLSNGSRTMSQLTKLHGNFKFVGIEPTTQKLCSIGLLHTGSFVYINNLPAIALYPSDPGHFGVRSFFVIGMGIVTMERGIELSLIPPGTKIILKTGGVQNDKD